MLWIYKYKCTYKYLYIINSMKTCIEMINTKFSIVLLGSRGTTSEFENSYFFKVDSEFVIVLYFLYVWNIFLEISSHKRKIYSAYLLQRKALEIFLLLHLNLWFSPHPIVSSSTHQFFSSLPCLSSQLEPSSLV